MTKPRFFISYCVDDKRFVYQACNLLEDYLGRDQMFLFETRPSLSNTFLAEIKNRLSEAECVIVFVGKAFRKYQWFELATAVSTAKKLFGVAIGGQRSEAEMPEEFRRDAGGRHIIFDHFTDAVPPRAVRCAERILEVLRVGMPDAKLKEWDPDLLLHGLTKSPQIFDYEKKIIEFYAAKRLMEVKSQLSSEDVTGLENLQRYERRLRKTLEDWPPERIEEKLNLGVPGDWPEVYRYEQTWPNRLDPEAVGAFREEEGGPEALVRAAALLSLDAPGEPFTFPEAGLRPTLAFPQPPRRELNVAVLVAGGIAPGINAVIDAIVQRHTSYRTAAATTSESEGYTLNIYGLRNGFLAIGGKNDSLDPHLALLNPQNTSEEATRGGSMLGTSRDEELLEPSERRKRLEVIADALSQDNRMIDILYVIGGDGSMKAAHALWTMVSMRRRPDAKKLSVVTIPKTMDNDILWVWQSFGFLSAVDESRRIVETLHTEVRSNPRLGIVQLFGSDSGFVVSHAVLAAVAGHASLALIPEIRFSAIGAARYLKQKLWHTAQPTPGLPQHSDPLSPIDPKFPHGLVVLSETAIPLDALECVGLRKPPQEFKAEYEQIAGNLVLTKAERDEIEDFDNRRNQGLRLEGQTSDKLRQIGLKILQEAISVFIASEKLGVEKQPMWSEPNWAKLRVVRSEPRHLVRSLEPSTSDIITGQRLGLLAVDAAMAGYTDCMISQWLTEFALVPLELVVLGRKRIPAEGMFWKSVTSKTGQPADLVAPYLV